MPSPSSSTMCATITMARSTGIGRGTGTCSARSTSALCSWPSPWGWTQGPGNAERSPAMRLFYVKVPSLHHCRGLRSLGVRVTPCRSCSPRRCHPTARKGHVGWSILVLKIIYWKHKMLYKLLLMCQYIIILQVYLHASQTKFNSNIHSAYTKINPWSKASTRHN